jgi:HTH-type transcriptional regulator / antitoxin HigA
MNIHPIKTEVDYAQALTRLDELMGAEFDSPEGDELDVLATLIEAYELRCHPIEAPDPVAAIRFRMEQGELTRKDLESALGSRSRVSEILSGRRSLSLNMIRELHEQYRIPYENLMKRPT